MRNVRAFTLLEMLVATVLSSVLMIGVLAVVSTLGKPAKVSGISVAGNEAPGSNDLVAAMEAWEGLLREDTVQAAQIDVSKENELTLIGYGALDAATRERTHRPVRVSYTLEAVEGRLWLVRRQVSLDVMTDQNVQRDLLCSGLKRFKLTRPADMSGANPSQEKSPGGRWRLQVWIDGQEEPGHDRTWMIQANGGA